MDINLAMPMKRNNNESARKKDLVDFTSSFIPLSINKVKYEKRNPDTTIQSVNSISSLKFFIPHSLINLNSSSTIIKIRMIVLTFKSWFNGDSKSTKKKDDEKDHGNI